jgi:hypothetical protein
MRGGFVDRERPETFWHFVSRVVYGYFVRICSGFWPLVGNFDVGRDSCCDEHIGLVVNID